MQETRNLTKAVTDPETLINIPETRALQEAALAAILAAINLGGMFAVKAIGRKMGLFKS